MFNVLRVSQCPLCKSSHVLCWPSEQGGAGTVLEYECGTQRPTIEAAKVMAFDQSDTRPLGSIAAEVIRSVIR